MERRHRDGGWSSDWRTRAQSAVPAVPAATGPLKVEQLFRRKYRLNWQGYDVWCTGGPGPLVDAEGHSRGSEAAVFDEWQGRPAF
jgi:hypothetical protein